MSRHLRFRLYIDNQPASREQLERVEAITVEQEIGMAWEARLEIPICLDRQGRWNSTDNFLLRPFTRLRIEISVRDDHFVPLIDGPIVDINSRLRFEPGRSTLTLTVCDDSIFLNRHEEHFALDEASDYEIITKLFRRCEQISRTEIDDDLRDNGEDSLPFRANGTAMQVLLSLARIHDKHVYVLPGDYPGESTGCCKALPSAPERQSDGLEPLVLLGEEANIRDFDVDQDFSRPAEYAAATVRIADKSVVASSGSFRDRALLGDTMALPAEQEPAHRILRPNPFDDRRPERATAARAQASGFALLASGAVIDGRYQDVLQPYRLVTVQAGETPLSGEYVIRQVTHSLGRSSYSQAFTLMRNATSETGGESPAEAARSLF
ncbi:MAG: hypothetical protein BWK76_10885 [Desulfobulbaceae bacterium A2]|nr:MAG: hypothetical protein BWK76_10885 [Desulfobulbaceae bacterium A2]